MIQQDRAGQQVIERRLKLRNQLCPLRQQAGGGSANLQRRAALAEDEQILLAPGGPGLGMLLATGPGRPHPLRHILLEIAPERRITREESGVDQQPFPVQHRRQQQRRLPIISANLAVDQVILQLDVGQPEDIRQGQIGDG